MPCYQATLVVPFHPMLVPVRYPPDAPKWLRKHYFVEFLKYSATVNKLQVDVSQVQQVDYESLRFVPFPVFSPMFAYLDQMFTERLKEDLYSSLLANFPVYTPPLFMLLLEQQPMLGQLAREKLRRKQQGLAEIQLTDAQVAYEKSLAENPGAQFDPTMPVLTVYRMYKLFLYILGASVIHTDKPLDQDDGSKKFRENLDWVTMLRTSFETIGRRLDRYRMALYQAVEKVENETGKRGAEAIDCPPKGLDTPETTGMTRVEWFTRELQNYSVAIVRGLELHLMMLCGVPIRSNTTLFMCPSLCPEKEALINGIEQYCSVHNGGMAQVINERYTEALGGVKPFPSAPNVQIVKRPKEEQATTTTTTVVDGQEQQQQQTEEDDSIMVPVDYDISLQAYARGVFIVMSHHWSTRVQQKEAAAKDATAAASRKNKMQLQLTAQL